jgi:hypothetical protein
MEVAEITCWDMVYGGELFCLLKDNCLLFYCIYFMGRGLGPDEATEERHGRMMCRTAYL